MLAESVPPGEAWLSAEVFCTVRSHFGKRAKALRITQWAYMHGLKGGYSPTGMRPDRLARQPLTTDFAAPSRTSLRLGTICLPSAATKTGKSETII